MNPPDNIRDQQCRVCGARIEDGQGVYEDPDEDGLGDAAYYHDHCLA